MVFHLLLKTPPSASKAVVLRDSSFLGGSEEAEGMSLRSTVWPDRKGPGPPFPGSGAPLPSFSRSGHFLFHISPRWLQRHPNTHTDAYMLMLIHSKPKPYTHSHTSCPPSRPPHAPPHAPRESGASHKAHGTQAFFPPPPAHIPEGQVGLPSRATVSLPRK